MNTKIVEDLNTLSFGQQTLRMIENMPHQWANGTWKGKRQEVFINEMLGGFIIKWPFRVAHQGLVRDWFMHGETKDDKMKLHVRSLSAADQIRIFLAYKRWKRRALNLNALPLDNKQGSVLSIYGP